MNNFEITSKSESYLLVDIDGESIILIEKS